MHRAGIISHHATRPPANLGQLPDIGSSRKIDHLRRVLLDLLDRSHVHSRAECDGGKTPLRKRPGKLRIRPRRPALVRMLGRATGHDCHEVFWQIKAFYIPLQP